jgi:hypothetical protein
MNFEKLVSLVKSTDLDKKASDGFKTRLKKRETIYTARAKSQSPTDKFFSRSYNL